MGIPGNECHEEPQIPIRVGGSDGRGRPVLAGQHYRYLIRELEETAAGRRPGMDEEHRQRIRKLSEDERIGVADYLSRLSPHLAPERKSGE